MDLNEFQKTIYWQKRKELEAVARNIGLVSSYTPYEQAKFKEGGKKYPFLLMEAYARTKGFLVLLDINPELKIRQHPQYDTFDVDYVSGGTTEEVEFKVRLIGSGDYPTLDISFKKGESLNEMRGKLVVICDVDNEWFLWDLDKYKPSRSSWRKNHYTAPTAKNYKETEDTWAFDKSKAIMRGNLSHWYGT